MIRIISRFRDARMGSQAEAHIEVDGPHVDGSARPRVIIVGAGLAGSCAALALAAEYDVTVVDAGPAVPGASDVGAGLVNPLLGRQGRRVWRSDEALASLRALGGRTPLVFASFGARTAL